MVENIVIKPDNEEVYSLVRETSKQTSIMNYGNYNKKTSELHKGKCYM